MQGLFSRSCKIISAGWSLCFTQAPTPVWRYLSYHLTCALYTDFSRRPSLCDKSGPQLLAQPYQCTYRWRNRHSQDHNPNDRKLWIIRYHDVKLNKSSTSGSARENETTQETWSKIINLWIQWAIMLSLTKTGFVKRSLSFLAEGIIIVNPVGGFDIDSAIVGVQEFFIRPSS